MLAYSLLSLAAAAPVFDPQNEKYLLMSIDTPRPRVVARNTIKSGVQNEGLFFFTEICFGNPRQTQKVLIDTGSSDIRINSNSNGYDINHSSTFERGAIHDSLTTGNEPAHDQFWGSDMFAVGGKQFRLLFKATTGPPGPQVLGLGLPEDSEYTQTHVMNRVGIPTYPNFMEMLLQQGLIHRKVFSLWLVGGSNDNSFIIGGIDQNKYYGKLGLVPLVDKYTLNDNTPSRHLSIMLHSIRSKTGWRTEMNEPVLLNTGSYISFLPSRAFEDLCRFLNIDPNQNAPSIDCGCSGKFEFNFSGIFIPVDLRDLIVRNNQHACKLAVQRGNPNRYSLGTTALRAMYLVFDQQSQQVGIAPAIHPRNVVGEDVIEVPSDGIPNASMAPYYNARHAN